jgi:hypothetical protein
LTFVGVALLPIGHRWLRVVARDWDDPLDPTYAQRLGGRWNPPDSWPTLYLNRDLDTSRAQITRLLQGTPITADDLTDDAFALVSAVLPPAEVVDCVSGEGLIGAGLPLAYPVDDAGRDIDHDACQRIGIAAHDLHFEGIEARSAVAGAASPESSELAWWGHDAQVELVGPRVAYGEWRSPAT